MVSAPAHGLVRAVFPCEDGHAQERSLLGQGLETVHAHDLWRQDRNCCPCALLWTIDRRGAGCITRQHAGLPCAVITTLRPVGRIATGQVAEQRVHVRDAQGETHLLRRIRVKRAQATRAGDRVLSLLTTVPLRTASATRVARVDRKRWTLETPCQHLAASFHAAIKTLGSPKAALFGLCLALVASTMVAVVLAALRSVHGGEAMAQGLSLSSVANDIAQTSHGMMMAIPEDAWRLFRRMRPAELVAPLRALAQQVRLEAYRTSPRGPKKPRPKRENTTKSPHVSTAKLLRNREVNAVAP